VANPNARAARSFRSCRRFRSSFLFAEGALATGNKSFLAWESPSGNIPRHTEEKGVGLKHENLELETSMTSQSTDSLDLEIVMFCENIFDIFIPDDEVPGFDGAGGMEKWLELRLSNQRPKKDAAALLRMLAEAQQRPELAQGLGGTWRCDQVSAIVREIFRKRASPMDLHEMLLLPPLQRAVERKTKSGRPLIRGWRKLLPGNASVVLFAALLTLVLLYRQFLR
jgi:acyl carrier protein